MRSSPVTTAIQSPPKVTASARVPAGKVMLSGRVRGCVRSSPEKRMTSNATMTTTPTIIVAVNTVTSRARNFSVAGLTGGGLSSMGQDPLVFRIGDDPPSRLDKALSRDVPEAAALSRTRLTRLLDEGAVRVNGTVVSEAKARVAPGDLIVIDVPDTRESHIGAEEIALVVVHEDDDLIVIDKPAGMVVHPAPGSPAGTLVNALLHHCGDSLSGVGGARRPGIVHRIDKDTSGLLVVAKSDAAHQGLAALLEAQRRAGLSGRGPRRARGERSAPARPARSVIRGGKCAAHRHRPRAAQDRPAAAGGDVRGRTSCGDAHAGAGAVRPSPRSGASGMPTGDRAHPSDPGASGACRAWAHWRSGLWRAAQAVAKSAIAARDRGCAGLCPAGAARRRARLYPSGERRGAAVRGTVARRYVGTDRRIAGQRVTAAQDRVSV